MSSFATFLAGPEIVGHWSLDREQSRIDFVNGTMWGAVKVRGSFDDISASGDITAVKTVSGRVDIKADSIDTGLKARDRDLRRANFFDSDRFPDITVVVTSGQFRDGDTVRLDSDLTIKGITGQLPLIVTVSRLEDGGVRLSTTTTVTRKQFAVEGNFLAMVGNKTKLKADLVFRKL